MGSSAYKNIKEKYNRIGRQNANYQKQAMQTTKDYGRNVRRMYQPYADVGNQAFGIMQNAYGLNGPEAQAQHFANYVESPEVAWRREEGLRSIDQDSAAGRALFGGNRIQDTTKYSQNLSTQGYGNYMQGIAGMNQIGQSATGNIANSLTNEGRGVAGLQVGIGDTLANAELAGIQGFFGAGQATQEMFGNMFDMISGGVTQGITGGAGA